MTLKSLSVALITLGTLTLSLNAHAVGPAYNGGGSPHGSVCTHQQNGNVLLRSGPGQKYKVLARMPNGSDVSIIDEREVGGWLWYKVKYNRLVGWARHDYICL